MTRQPWGAHEDVVLAVAGRYTVLGATCSPEWDDGRVLVRWADRTTTRIQGDLLMTPGDAAVMPTLETVMAERDRARDLAAGFESQLARIEAIVDPPLFDKEIVDRVFRIREELAGVTW